jgi:hypothetical protein
MKLLALMPLLGAAMTVAACYSAGTLVIARLGVTLRRIEKTALAFVLGAACMHLAMFAILALKIAYKPVLWALAIGTIGAAIAEHVRHVAELRAPAGAEVQEKFGWPENLMAWGYAAIFAAFTVYYFVNAWAPEASADGVGYHLGLITDYLRAHGFRRITTNMYAGLGQGAELLYGLAFSFGRYSAAPLVHFSFAIALALSMWAYGIRIGKSWIGVGAALLVYLSPVVGRDATTAYIDVVPAAAVFAAFHWLEIWEESGNDRVLIPVGLLAGYAYATKYTAAMILIYALIIVWWRKRALGQRMWRPLLTVCACAALMILPWMVKNWLYLHDPIAPLGTAIFRNANLHVSAIKEWEEYLRNYDLPSKWKLPIALTVRGTLVQGILGPIFLAAPIALLALRQRVGRRLLLAGVLVLTAYPGNLGTRFLIPVLPFVSMAMVLAVGNAPWIVAIIVLIHAATSWPDVLRRYADGIAWRLDIFPIRAALRLDSEESYLNIYNSSYTDARFVEKYVPRGERVLTPTPIADAYTSHEMLTGFQGAFNQTLIDILYIGSFDGLRPKIAMVFQFPEQTGRRVRVVQTLKAEPHKQWSVHEIRFLRGGVEIPRSPEWKLRAWPNAWDVQLAFDNSPATRWRSWEYPTPGMFIETDFGGDKTLDQVVVETSEDGMWDVKLRAEMMDRDGKWITLNDKPAMRAIPAPLWIRRAATREILLRGVRYVLIHDSDYGGSDYREDPDLWGFKVIAHEREVTLYRIEP